MALMMMVIGTVVSVAGAMQQSAMIKQQAEAQASIAEYNAAQKDKEAQQTLDSAMIEEQRLARMARLFKGEQVARIGMSGTEFGGGSNIEVLGDIAFQTKMDRENLLRSGTIAGAQSRAEAEGQRFEARWARLYGKQKASAAMMGGLASGISGVFKMSGALGV